MAKRMAALPRVSLDVEARGYRKLFLTSVKQADEGCDFDFLRVAEMKQRVPRG
jgi:dihydroxy-acid dehydratase